MACFLCGILENTTIKAVKGNKFWQLVASNRVTPQLPSTRTQFALNTWSVTSGNVLVTKWGFFFFPWNVIYFPSHPLLLNTPTRAIFFTHLLSFYSNHSLWFSASAICAKGFCHTVKTSRKANMHVSRFESSLKSKWKNMLAWLSSLSLIPFLRHVIAVHVSMHGE